MPNDLMKSIQGSQDRISKLLNQQTARYTAGDFLTSMMGQGTPIAQIAQKRRADEIQNQRGFLQDLQRSRGLDIQEGRLNLSKEQFEYEQTKYRAKRGDETFGALSNTIELAPEQERQRLHSLVSQHPDSKNDMGGQAMTDLVARVARENNIPLLSTERHKATESLQGKYDATQNNLDVIRAQKKASMGPAPKTWLNDAGEKRVVNENDIDEINKARKEGFYQKDSMSRGSRVTWGGFVYDQNNKRVGVAVRHPDGTRSVASTSGESIPWQEGFREINVGAETKSRRNRKQWFDFKKFVKEERQGIDKFIKYWETVKNAPQGFGLALAKAAGNFITFFGKDITDESILNVFKSKAKVNALMGWIKDTVLGGGVLSDRDVKILFQALGGDANMWRNKSVVAGVLSDILKEKIEMYNEVFSKEYNDSLGRWDPQGKMLKPIDFDYEATFGQTKKKSPKTWTVKEGSRAINKKTNERLIFRNGKWVPFNPEELEATGVESP